MPCRAISLVFVAFSLAIASCSGSMATSGSVTLLGAGATFPAPLYQKWFADYDAAHPEVRVSYLSLGSGPGIELFTEGKADFGASDAGMTDEQINKVGGGVQLLPVTAANVVLAYNLPGFSGNLKLSRDAYAGIFLGTITSWDDPKITESNQGASLPKLKISPLHRQAASGTTFVFTQHLSAISDAWKSGPGKGMTVAWPSGTAARGSDDVVALIQKEPGSIGYLSYGHAEKSKLPMAWLQNKSGEYVKPSLESGQATLSSAPLPENLRGWVPDPEGKDSYPIVTYTWLLVHKHLGNSRTAAALKDVLKYCVTDGQKDSLALGYLPLPEHVQQAVLQAVEALAP
ncbi:MAG: phosphate ABC transporter substrate-binding protein PstS [Isosphaeraceae bacterium]